jgi:V8-like Glu-specific endopeptidase
MRISHLARSQSITLDRSSNVKPGPVETRSYGGSVAMKGHRPGEVSVSASNPPTAKGPADRLRSKERFLRSAGGLIAKGDQPPKQAEAIIGDDDRQRVTNTDSWPYCVHGQIVRQFPNGRMSTVSGTMVNRHHVLTAGHCVYSHADGGWATWAQFNPGRNGDALPFGQAWATDLFSVKGWTEQGMPEWDFGMLILDRDMGSFTGWFGVISLASDDDLNHRRVNITGYPLDKGGAEMWTHGDAIHGVTEQLFYYDIDTYGGQSGAGAWSVFEGYEDYGELVAGVHIRGEEPENSATRISRPKFERIYGWCHGS